MSDTAQSIGGNGGDPLDGAVRVEVVGEMNHQLLFGPTQQRLRGKWDTHNIRTGEQTPQLAAMPTVPGMTITVWPLARRAETADPLLDPVNKELLARISAAYQQLPNVGRPCCGVPTKCKEAMNDDELATWLYWMRQAVNAGYAAVVRGELPAAEADLKKLFPKGKVQKEFFRQSARRAS